MARTPTWIQPATIVIVDDDPVALGLITDIIERIPHASATAFEDPAEALAWCQASSPDVIISDYRMPGMDGLELVRHLRTEAHLDDVPIMIVTANDEREVRHRALELGVNDFLGKPLDPAEVIARIKNMILVHQARRGTAVRAQELAFQIGVATTAAAERERELVLRLAAIGEHRDWGSDAHVLRVAHFCRLIARQRKLPEAEQERIFLAASLHDVGKIGVPDRILLKPGPLDADERAVMQQHTMIGYRLLGADTASPILQYAAVMARTHHEHVDGSGYPDRLKGDQIPLSGRILAVADVFDALTSHRPYRAAWTIEAAVTYLRGAAGAQFDANCVDGLLRALPEILEIRNRFSDDGPGVAVA